MGLAWRCGGMTVRTPALYTTVSVTSSVGSRSFTPHRPCPRTFISGPAHAEDRLRANIACRLQTRRPGTGTPLVAGANPATTTDSFRMHRVAFDPNRVAPGGGIRRMIFKELEPRKVQRLGDGAASFVFLAQASFSGSRWQGA